VRGKHLDVLKRVPLFQGLSRRELANIFAAGRELEFPAGATVIQEGSVASDFYLVLDGTGAVSIKGRRIRPFGPGDFFGEIAILDDSRRTATVVAKTRTWVFRLDRKAFLALLDLDGRIARKVLVEFAKRVRS
jgi:CRP-like cAMP-binding protein